MKLIKKSEKLLLEQMKMMEEAEEQNLSEDNINHAQEPTVEEEEEPKIVYRKPNHMPMGEYPVVQSVGNTGWQVSEIWKDIRLDNF